MFRTLPHGNGTVILVDLLYFATNIEGITSWVKDEYNGLLVNPGSKSEIQNAIKRLITNKKLSKNIATNGYELVQKKYSWDLIIKMIINEYNELRK